MKPLVWLLVLFAAVPASLRAQAGSIASVDFKGHLIGEGISDFLRIEPEAQQEFDVCHLRPERRSCDRVNAALHANGRVEISTTGSVNFVLDGGKLVKITMLVDRPMDDATFDLTQKFGVQAKATLLPSQNNTGDKWNNQLHTWDTPTAYVTLYQDNNPGMQDHRLLLMAESRAEHLLEDMDSSKRPTSVASTAAPAGH